MRWKLPQLIERVNRYGQTVKLSADTNASKYADGLVETIRTGILKNNLVSPALANSTIQRKKRMGLPRPRTRLYATGQLMMKNLKARRIQNGYRVQPEGQHNSGMSAQKIWAIHEYGTATIPARYPMARGIARFNRSEEKKRINRKAERELKKSLT